MLRDQDRFFEFVQISQYLGCLPLKCGYKFDSHESDTILSLLVFHGNAENHLGQLTLAMRGLPERGETCARYSTNESRGEQVPLDCHCVRPSWA